MKEKSKSKKKDGKLKAKAMDRNNDTSGARGLTAGQHLSTETVKINRQRLTHQNDETRLAGMSIQ